MLLPRVIARLDIKGPNVVKGIQFEGLRVMGEPNELAKRYASAGAHELYVVDTVSSLYGRPQVLPLVDRISRDVFVPIVVGGGVQSLSHVRELLRAGADAVSVNTAAIRNPELVSDIAQKCGSQALTVSIEAKRIREGWEAYVENGREKTGRCAIQWAKEAEQRGAGQILVTSVDKDGTMKGFDLELISAIASVLDHANLVACGGMGTLEHAKQAMEAGASAVACASALHYGKVNFRKDGALWSL